MNKSTLAMAFSMAIFGLASTSVSAIDGNINFLGEVTDTTCLINGTTPNGAVDVNVNLKAVQASSLSSSGTTANATPFKITLGGPGDLNCTNGKIAAVYFEPNSPAIDKTTGWLKNIETTNPASRVQVQILNGETNDAINLLTGVGNIAPKTIAGNTAEYNYFGQYIAVDGAATPGKVASTVRYSIVYQ
ncbi:fimbrial protein [Serratia sp. L9]|uniref:fimbrial protein n=1 Tax=Serratia sp. L9 TaxID=3423946 RepID=UPI003D666469